jgi:hypothetical protein
MTAAENNKLETIITKIELLQMTTKDGALKGRLATAKSELIRALKR